jgi:hypothetical protein
VADATEILYEALSSELGVVIQTDDPVAFRQRLYAAMRADPALNVFTVHLSRLNPTAELLLIKKDQNDA